MVEFEPTLRAYARLPFNRGGWRMPAVQPRATLFVDIPPGRAYLESDPSEVDASVNEILTQLRDAPVEVFLPARIIVIRWPYQLVIDDLLQRSLDKVQGVLRPRMVKADLGFLVQVPGTTPALI